MLVELGNDEKVLIKSEKTLMYFYVSILSLVFFSLIFILDFDIISLYDFFMKYILAPIFWLFVLFLFFLGYDYSFNSSVYLTNKRFVFCKKNKEESVNFGDVLSIFYQNNWFVIKDKFGKTHRAIAKNAPSIASEFFNIYSQYNQNKKSENPILWVLLVLAIIGFNGYGRPYLKNTPSPYVKISTADYMANMQNKIKRNWQSNLCAAGEEIVVSYSIFEDGKIANIQIIESSGNSKLDKSAISALEQASPFLPLPKQLKKEKNSIDVKFTFQCK